MGGGGSTKTVAKQELSKQQKSLMNLVLPAAQNYMKQPTKLPPNIINTGANPIEAQGMKSLLQGGNLAGLFGTGAMGTAHDLMATGGAGALAGGQGLLGAGGKGLGALGGLLQQGGMGTQGLQGLAGLGESNPAMMRKLRNQGTIGSQGIGGALGMGQQGQQGLQSLINAAQTSAPALKRIASGEFMDPNSQLLRQQSEAVTRGLRQDLQRNVLPGLSAGAVMDGTFGGSRQGIAEGLAVSDFTKQAMDARTNLQANNFNQGLQGMIQAAGLGTQAAQGAGQLGAQGFGTAAQGLNSAVSGAQIGAQGLQGLASIGAGSGQAAGQIGAQALGAGTNAMGNMALQSLLASPNLASLALLPGSVQSMVGGQQRALGQAQAQEMNERFTTQQMLPFLKAQEIANLAFGMGGGKSTTTGQQPGATAAQTAVGAGSVLAGISQILPFLPMLSDARLKTDIRFEGVRHGYRWYSYSYRGLPGRHEGVMAQEVEKINPELVFEAGGYKMVNYPRLLAA